MADVATQRA